MWRARERTYYLTPFSLFARDVIHVTWRVWIGRRQECSEAGRQEPVDPSAPLLCNPPRICSDGRWRDAAGSPSAGCRWSAALDRSSRFGPLYPFHALRHTAVTNVYRASRDLFLAPRFARHASPLTMTVYTHPSDQEMFERLRDMEWLGPSYYMAP